MKTVTRHLNLTAIQAITPILALLDGYAAQNEPVVSVEWEDNVPVSITFPALTFTRTRCGDGHAWVLSGSNGMIAAFVA